MGNFKVKFLGTNGWYTTSTGNTLCVFCETPSSYIVLDAGNGIKDIDKYITDDTKPVYIFLSHFHIDHIEGLHILAKFKFPQGITICCASPGKEILNKLIMQPYTVPFSNLKTKVHVKELDEGVYDSFPFKLTVKELVHSAKCLGYRFEEEGKVLSFCTDTGYCESALLLAKGANLLITECGLKSGEVNPSWPHMNPEDAAKLAKESGAKKLVLAHFDADNYKSIEERDFAEKCAEKIFPESTASKDGMEIVV